MNNKLIAGICVSLCVLSTYPSWASSSDGLYFCKPHHGRCTALKKSHFNPAESSYKGRATGRRYIVVNLSQRTFAAYDENGNLVYSGRVSGGKSWCPDLKRSCRTPTGTFTVYSEEGSKCKSTIFPLKTHGGAPMPYCMYFHGAYALHGSYEVPNYNASHGCIRLHRKDAEWLYYNFTRIGTRVIVHY